MGAELESRDLDKERLTEAELDELIGSRDYKEFLNTRNETLSHAENEGTSAHARGGHQTHGEGAESHSQADRASRVADDSGI